MNFETIIAIVGGLLAGLAGFAAVLLRVPKKLKPEYFVSQWRDLQAFCKDKKTWPDALTQADKLLDRALKKRKFKGKTMGERMVSAQRMFTENDAVWYAHNLHKKSVADSKFRLKESEVKDALIGFRQALRDLGALPENNQEKKS